MTAAINNDAVRDHYILNDDDGANVFRGRDNVTFLTSLLNQPWRMPRQP